MYQAATSLETIQVVALFSQRCSKICRYNWIADYIIYNHACPQNHVNP